MMLIKVTTLGFAALMILGATCDEQSRDPETIAHCIDPRRIDFDHGVRQACDTAQRIAHPIDSMSAAFTSRWSDRNETQNGGFQTVTFSDR
jgi:hypothetical protein